jgi:toxin HigB-1
LVKEIIFVMKIYFSTNKLQKTFNSHAELVKKYGDERAKMIERRMSVLKAAVNLEEVPTIKPERCHQLVGDRKYEYAVDLKHPFRLIFTPNLNSHKEKFDLKEITEIVILGVENYHDK